MVVRFEKLVAVLVVVMATMITGCNSSQHRYSKEEFAKNKHGVVFFDIRSDGVSVPFSIANQETGEVVPEYFIDNWLGLKPTENPDLVLRSLLLEPGTYYIKRIGISSGLSGNKSFYDNNENGVIIYGAFQVKAGEVLSLGLLNIDYSGDTNHKYNFSTLHEQLLNSDKRELTFKLKQGRFYGAGSLITEDKNGNKVITSAKDVAAYEKQILQEKFGIRK